MIERNLRPNVVSFGSVLHGHALVGEVKSAEGVFQNMFGHLVRFAFFIIQKARGHCVGSLRLIFDSLSYGFRTVSSFVFACSLPALNRQNVSKKSAQLSLSFCALLLELARTISTIQPATCEPTFYTLLQGKCT